MINPTTVFAMKENYRFIFDVGSFLDNIFTFVLFTLEQKQQVVGSREKIIIGLGVIETRSEIGNAIQEAIHLLSCFGSNFGPFEYSLSLADQSNC